MSSTYDRIYDVVRQIPPGQVATYGQIAELAEMPGQARLVGYALYRVDMETSDIPWHRVINAKGEVSTSPFRHGTDHLQRSLLEQEGIEFNAEGKIALGQYRWQPHASDASIDSNTAAISATAMPGAVTARRMRRPKDTD